MGYFSKSVYKISSFQDNTTVGNYLIVSNQTSWTMSARSFAYGFYYVTYRVGNPANPRQVGFDYGFLKIIPGPLYVYISKGSKAVYVEKSNIIMDGLETYDPDVFAQKGKSRLLLQFNNMRTLLNQRLCFSLPSIISADVSGNRSSLQRVQ